MKRWLILLGLLLGAVSAQAQLASPKYQNLDAKGTITAETGLKLPTGAALYGMWSCNNVDGSGAWIPGLSGANGISYDPTTGIVGFNGASDGWAQFIGGTLTGGYDPSNGTIADTTHRGLLDSADFVRFNSYDPTNGAASAAITALTSDVTASGPGSVTATIAAGAVTLAKMANMATSSLLGRKTALAGAPEVLSAADAKTVLAIGQADVAGLTTAATPQFAGVGLGVAGAANWLTFPALNSNIAVTGISWYPSTPGNYGIYNSGGAWSAPYSQLTLAFLTGIVINPGTAYAKSFMDVQGNGIRVTAGGLSVGSTTAPAKLYVEQSTDANVFGMVEFLNPTANTGNRYIESYIGKTLSSPYLAGTLGYYVDNSTTANSGLFLCNYGDSEPTAGLFVKKGGATGRGTSTPQSDFHVVGTVQATTGFTYGGSASVGGTTFCDGSGNLTPAIISQSAASLTPFTATCTDAGASPSVFDVYRNSASPAVGDSLGELIFNGKDSGGTKIPYSAIRTLIVDKTAGGTQQGRLCLDALSTGILTNRFTVDATGTHTYGEIYQGATKIVDSTAHWVGPVITSPATHTTVSVWTGSAGNTAGSGATQLCSVACTPDATKARRSFEAAGHINNSDLDTNLKIQFVGSAGYVLVDTGSAALSGDWTATVDICRTGATTAIAKTHFSLSDNIYGDAPQTVDAATDITTGTWDGAVMQVIGTGVSANTVILKYATMDSKREP